MVAYQFLLFNFDQLQYRMEFIFDSLFYLYANFHSFDIVKGYINI
jgi:hypothetical protein